MIRSTERLPPQTLHLESHRMARRRMHLRMFVRDKDLKIEVRSRFRSRFLGILLPVQVVIRLALRTLRKQAQVSPKAASSRTYDAQLDDSYARKHQQRASSMPLTQNTDFYPSLDASLNSPPLADRAHGRRATVDNGYSHDRAQAMPSHRSHLGPVPLVDRDQGRFSYHLQTSYPQAILGVTSHSRPLNAASPSAPTD